MNMICLDYLLMSWKGYFNHIDRYRGLISYSINKFDADPQIVTPPFFSFTLLPNVT